MPQTPKLFYLIHIMRKEDRYSNFLKKVVKKLKEETLQKIYSELNKAEKLLHAIRKTTRLLEELEHSEKEIRGIDTSCTEHSPGHSYNFYELNIHTAGLFKEMKPILQKFLTNHRKALEEELNSQIHFKGVHIDTTA